MRIVIASNPAARFGRSTGVGERVAARLRAAGHDDTLEVAATWVELLERTRDAASTADALVVVGGDGMVHLGVNAVGGTPVPLAVVPSGSGNDFASTLGIQGTEQAIDALPSLLAREPARCDLIRVEHASGTSFAAGIVSVGFDADVTVRSLTLEGVPPRIRYHAAILLTLARLTHREFRIRIDGGAWQPLRTVIAPIANHRHFGGGIPIAPTASTTDGRITGVFADELTAAQFARLLVLALRGRHLGDPRVRVRDFARIEIEGDPRVLACADGEILGRLPIVCEVVPGALRVYGMPR